MTKLSATAPYTGSCRFTAACALASSTSQAPAHLDAPTLPSPDTARQTATQVAWPRLASPLALVSITRLKPPVLDSRPLASRFRRWPNLVLCATAERYLAAFVTGLAYPQPYRGFACHSVPRRITPVPRCHSITASYTRGCWFVAARPVPAAPDTSRTSRPVLDCHCST